MDNNGILMDIVAKMRENAEQLDKDGDIAGVYLRVYADRIEAAAERERGKWEQERRAYEKLHDCFWAEDAIQNIVRQMLDARDDLRRVDPREADDLQYYAHELMRAAQRPPATPPRSRSLRATVTRPRNG